VCSAGYVVLTQGVPVSLRHLKFVKIIFPFQRHMINEVAVRCLTKKQNKKKN
jgi:hypothetical protein